MMYWIGYRANLSNNAQADRIRGFIAGDDLAADVLKQSTFLTSQLAKDFETLFRHVTSAFELTFELMFWPGK